MPLPSLPEAEKASSEELLLLAQKLERLVVIKRMVDAESGEDGAGMVLFSGRELELMAGCVRTVAGERWREGR